VSLHKNLKAWALFCVACSSFMLVGCSEESTLPSAPDISSFGDGGGSDRTVVITDGAVGGDFDAPVRVDAKPITDAGAVDSKVVDAKATGDSGADTAMAGTPRLCDMLKQDCPGQKGCYPYGNGGSRCESLVKIGLSGSPCFQNSECPGGSACAVVVRDERRCSLLCDRNFLCGGKDSCLGITGYNDVGYCNPN